MQKDLKPMKERETLEHWPILEEKKRNRKNVTLQK
jgi:hypothetical protein